MGFAFLGVVIGYLPTMYSAFSQREIEISLLDARAGSPPTAAEFLRRNAGSDGVVIDGLRRWEAWAAQLLETQSRTRSSPITARSTRTSPGSPR